MDSYFKFIESNNKTRIQVCVSVFVLPCWFSIMFFFAYMCYFICQYCSVLWVFVCVYLSDACSKKSRILFLYYYYYVFFCLLTATSLLLRYWYKFLNNLSYRGFFPSVCVCSPFSSSNNQSMNGEMSDVTRFDVFFCSASRNNECERVRWRELNVFFLLCLSECGEGEWASFFYLPIIFTNTHTVMAWRRGLAKTGSRAAFLLRGETFLFNFSYSTYFLCTVRRLRPVLALCVSEAPRGERCVCVLVCVCVCATQ